MLVGTEVVVKIVNNWIRGKVVEDRGCLGVGGRRILRVALEVDPEVGPMEIELPAERLRTSDDHIRLELEAIRHRDKTYRPRGKRPKAALDRRWLLKEVERLQHRINNRKMDEHLHMDEHLQMYARAQELAEKAAARRVDGDEAGYRLALRAAASLTDDATDLVDQSQPHTRATLCRAAVVMWLEVNDRERAESSFQKHRVRMPKSFRILIKELLEKEP